MTNEKTDTNQINDEKIKKIICKDENLNDNIYKEDFLSLDCKLYDDIDETKSIYLDSKSNSTVNSYAYSIILKEVKEQRISNCKNNSKIKSNNDTLHDSTKGTGEKNNNNLFKKIMSQEEINKYLESCKSKRERINDSKQENCLIY